MTRNALTRAAPPRSRHDIPAQDDMACLPTKPCKTLFLPQLVTPPAPAAAKTIEQHMRDAIPTESCFQGIWQKIQSTVGSEQQCPARKRKLEDEGGFRRKTRQRARASIEVRHPARLVGHFDKKISLTLTWVSGVPADHYREPAPFLQLCKEGGGTLRNAAVEQDHVVRTASGVTFGQGPCQDFRIGDGKLA